MLEYQLTPHHAGVALWGDFGTLERLHGLIHRIVENSGHIEDKEGFVLGLAYDIRKAYEGQRSQDYRYDYNDDRCRIYGVEILWPVLLVQIGMLRQSMAFIPTNKLDQAIMFELEYVVESAVRAAMPIMAEDVIHRIGFNGSAPYRHIHSVLDSRCRYFIKLPVKQRLKVLPELMNTFDPIYAFLSKTGAGPRPGAIPLSAFTENGEEWPDFKW
jgi:hypothetical protein